MTTRWRLGLILGVGLGALGVMLGYRASRRPEPAPAQVQASGRRILAEEMHRLRGTDFGASTRGALLLHQVEALLAGDRIVFSAELGGRRGLSWHEVLGAHRVYLRVMEMAQGRYLHQTPGQIVEAACHEAVHWKKGRGRRTSVEEECDAFAAGLCAQAALQGLNLSDPLALDGLPVAEFVTRSYPDARRNPRYAPLGETRAWLSRRTGLR